MGDCAQKKKHQPGEYQAATRRRKKQAAVMRFVSLICTKFEVSVSVLFSSLDYK